MNMQYFGSNCGPRSAFCSDSLHGKRQRTGALQDAVARDLQAGKMKGAGFRCTPAKSQRFGNCRQVLECACPPALWQCLRSTSRTLGFEEENKKERTL